MWGGGSAGTRGKEEPRGGRGCEWPRLMVLEKVKGHLGQVGMLCSEQSWALAAPSSFHSGSLSPDTSALWCGSEGEVASQRQRGKGHCVSVGGGEDKHGQAGSWVRPGGVPFWYCPA